MSKSERLNADKLRIDGVILTPLTVLTLICCKYSAWRSVLQDVRSKPRMTMNLWLSWCLSRKDPQHWLVDIFGEMSEISRPMKIWRREPTCCSFNLFSWPVKLGDWSVHCDRCGRRIRRPNFRRNGRRKIIHSWISKSRRGKRIMKIFITKSASSKLLTENLPSQL